MKRIKVKLVFEGQSAGRGVGFYGEALQKYLSMIPEIDLVERKPDLVHYTYFKLFQPDLPLVSRGKKTVVTIHDLTPLVLPELYPLGLKSKMGLLYQKAQIKKVDAIVTDSENSKNDIAALFGIDKHKIFVTPLASRPIFFEETSMLTMKTLRKKYKLPKQFVLTVAGGPNPNKNLYRLAAACQSLDLTLVIVGKGVGLDPATVAPHPELVDFFKISQMKNVMRLGFVSEEELLCLYKLATVYCQASIYEGFGLPLLEAMAAKTFVVSSNSSSLPEIYDSTTPTFDPLNIDSIIQSLRSSVALPENKKAEVIRRNYARSLDFSFERMARETLSAYKYTLMI